MIIRRIAISLIAVSALAACSGDDDTVAEPTGTEPPASVPDPTATDAPTSTPTTEPTSTAVPTPSTPPEPTPTSPPTTEPESIEVVLAGRVRDLFAARMAANDAPVPDPDDPGLAAVAIGEELADLIAETSQRRDNGLAFRAGDGALAEVRVGFVEAQETTATVSVCSIDDGVIYRLDTGDVVDDDVSTNNYQIDLQLVDGVWLTSRVVRLQQWEGVAGCALAPGDFPY